jgi:uncharacterized membrane protein YfcA
MFTDPNLTILLFIGLAGFYAGTQNTLAGGGSFITFPALMLAGLDPLAANITSTVALFPNQITSAATGRKLAGGIGEVSLSQLLMISALGGFIGALLLLNTPVTFFARLVPWLVLFATTIFAWGSLRKQPLHAASFVSNRVLITSQFLIGVYGGYFGGGIGFLMLAALTVAGQEVRLAVATKNILAMVMNASAVALFVFSGQVHWHAAIALAIGGIGGAFAGNYLLHKVSAKLLRAFVILVGIVLTVWLFLR